jgi:DNA-binding NtrC family response regulator
MNPQPPEKQAMRILVIDDEEDMLANYRRLLKRTGYECLTLADPAQALASVPTFQPDLVITDYIMPGLGGLEVLSRIHEIDPALPVIMVTGFGSVEGAVTALKNRAADYLTKPFSVEELLAKIQEALSRRLIGSAAAADANGPTAGQAEGEGRQLGIIGVSPALSHVLELTRRVARTDVNVLIVGASGTGKEVFARAIHRLSGRRDEIFVPVDCASLPENLLESELFGYRKGAFTGAGSDKMGLFEFAHRGTLFLDEIGEMPLALQSKLLRVLQERRFRPLGGREEIDIDVRVIAATNRDLDEALREKTFRSDLFYRLNVVTLRLPTLADRPEDVPLLAHHFLGQFVADNHLHVVGIDGAALECLRAYDWPGNVRELQNVIEHAATMARGTILEVEDLPEHVGRQAPAASGHDGQPKALFAAKDQLVDHFERDYLVSLLVEHRFNISRAAQSAGCHRRTLYRMIHRHGLDLETLKEQRRRKVRADRDPLSSQS